MVKIIKNNQPEFYSSSINGVNLQVKFAIPKVFFTKNIADKDLRVYYDIGFLATIGWEENNSASANYSLTSIEAVSMHNGLSIVQGEMAFKIFHTDSLEALKREIFKGINGGTHKIHIAEQNDNPYLTLEEDIELFELEQNPDNISWHQMPPFDIVLLSSTNEELQKKQVRRKIIRGVTITSEGTSESIASLEINAMANFIAVGGMTDWEVVVDE